MGKRVFLVSHNHLAEGMAGTVNMIFGAAPELSTFCLEPDGSVAELGAAVRKEVEAHPEDQAIIIADILGGSVCNQCLVDLNGLPNVKVIAGMSLPLVLGILSCDGELSDEDIQAALEGARSTTKLVTLDVSEGDSDGSDDFF